MQETLVIEFTKNHPNNPDWVCFDTSGTVIDEAVKGDPSALKSLAQDRFVIVLIPASDTLLLEINLPPVNKQRLLQALPFAVEDYVLADVETLHLVPSLNQFKKETLLPIAVVEHEKMKQWLLFLQQIRVKPDIITSTFSLVPREENTISGLIQNGELLLKLTPNQGFVYDLQNQDYLKQVLMTNAAKNICVYHEDANFPADLMSINVREKQISRKELYLQLINNRENVINLLQGKYALKKFRVPKGMLFVSLLVVFACWLILLISYPIVYYALLNSRLNALNQQIEVIYNKHFPTEKKVRFPKVQMEDRLSQLTRNENENKLLLLLLYFGKAHQEFPQVEIKQLRYHEDRAELELTAKSANDIANYTAKLKKLGLQVIQQNANLVEDKVSVNLLVER